ncbi:MAG: transcription-repair coupling factor [Microthrixaceae bacterium]
MSASDPVGAPQPALGAPQPALGGLNQLLRDEPGVLAALGRRSTVLVVPEAARAFTVAGLHEASRRSPVLVATPSVADAERLAADLANFLPAGSVEMFPAWETLPFERVSPSVETMGLRLRTLWRLRTADPTLAIVVVPARALAQRLGPGLEDLEPIQVSAGVELDSLKLIEDLVMSGYRREYQVEHRGEIAVRGSIIDIFPSTGDRPVRLDFWGDEVERLTEFSPGDQRSTTDVDQVQIFPARELLSGEEVAERAEKLMSTQPWGREQWQRFADGETFEGMEAWLPWLIDDERVIFDLIPADGQVLLVDPRRLKDRANDIVDEEHDLALSLSRTWGLDPEEADSGLPRLHLGFDRLLARTEAPVWSLAGVPDSPDSPAVSALAWPPAVGEGTALVTQLRQLINEGYSVVVCADGRGSAGRIDRLLTEHGLSFPALMPEDGSAVPGDRLRQPGGRIVVAPLERGCIFPALKLAFLAEADLSGRRRTHRAARAPKRDSQHFFEDLKVGDHVVHQVHGVGRFDGMVKRAMGGIERDYLLLEYRGGDKLYVPSDQIETVRLYSGGETPRLNKMGGADFSRAKAKVRSAVAEIAQELVVLYQTRVSTPGHAFGPDTPWQREMELAFPFQETTDQLTAIEAVKQDMESTVPMDRLVCGDVGFGKTEVAIRAAFKAVQDGFQVAILVPTTLLAQQHYQTFSDRFAGFPVRVESLSRFLTPAQSRSVVQRLASGEVDIVIGTHRLLSNDISFKKLGLLVVDEEQRFGVSHKESIKQFKAAVDVLTLTATPIPRTLEMSLTGIRDLSLLNTPPAARQPILTYVGEYDERAVTESIRRELLREGQVFYVHNRVRDIELQAARLQELVPEARIAVAHGQMDEGSLEKVVVDFWQGEYDVLVCTTIIESGIDMPTVNTLVVERADLLGLGQLHQLRGRVGRAGQRAYAYLFFPQDRQLSEDAYERLKTIGEATELGSGFRIAMRDLEIRGAGNLLGTGQSGHVAAVGYDLYVQMVNEAISELNGEAREEPDEIVLELPMPAFLPPDYVERDDLRLDAYRRLAAVQAEADVDDIASEWEDRFGAVPAPASALLDVARLRAECVRTSITNVTVTKNPALSGGGLVAQISPVVLPQSKQMRLARLYKGAVYRDADRELRLPVAGGPSTATDIVKALRELVPPEKPEAVSSSLAGESA